MAREGSLWSRTWGGIAVLAFAVELGAAVYEAVVVAPLWSVAPPGSVRAWAALDVRPDSSMLFHPLTAVVAVAAAMAWMSGVTERGWRRWWLTLALACAAALVFVAVTGIAPAERALFGAAALGGSDDAALVARTGDWIRGAAIRLAALLVGGWASYRAQLAASPATAGAAVSSAPASRRRTREFSFGDEPEDDLTLGDDAADARERWRSSLPARRRTAKK